jgi:hypothetical protein
LNAHSCQCSNAHSCQCSNAHSCQCSNARSCQCPNAHKQRRGQCTHTGTASYTLAHTHNRGLTPLAL